MREKEWKRREEREREMNKKAKRWEENQND